MAHLICGGVELPTPSVMTISLQDIDAATTTRSSDGTMLRDRVVGGATSKRKIEVEWNYLEADVASRILKAISAEFFPITYMDPYEGETRTAQFYAGDRTLPVYSLNLRDRGVLWEKLEVHFIEK